MNIAKRVITSLIVTVSVISLTTGVGSATAPPSSITPPKTCPNPLHYNVYAYANPSDTNPDKLTADSYRAKPSGQTTTTDAVVATAANHATYTDITFRTRAAGANVQLVCGVVSYLAGLTTPNWYYINQSLTFVRQPDGSYLASKRITQTADQKLLTANVYSRDTAFPLAP